MNKYTDILWIFGVVIFINLSSCQTQTTQPLTIATAANMQFAMKALSTEFTKQTNISCDIVVSSSGKLTAQIMEGAPFHILVSADMKYPQTLYNAGLAVDKPSIYAYGNLVLWTTIDSITPSLELMTTKTTKRIAIANPKTAPYGLAAMQTINQLGLFDDIKNKLVYGESISQTNQFIVSKATQVGFTAKSVVLSPNLKDKGQWVAIDTSLYAPIAQGIILLKNSTEELQKAQEFYTFIFSETGQHILKQFGYQIKLKN